MSRAVEILVTGGSGLVGSALKKICPEALYLNRSDADLTDFCQTRALFTRFRPQKVIHLAAKVGGVKTNAQKNADMFTINVQINANVLRVAQELRVEKLVAVLSNCVFQEKPPHPPTEDQIHIDMPYAGHLGYGYAKRMLDLQIYLMRQQYGCHFTSITPVTIFGPHDNWDLDEAHVVGSLIHKCYLAKNNQRALEVWGSGRTVRQFVFSEDIAKVLLMVLERYEDPETIIVAPDEGVSIADLARAIAKAMGFKGPIHCDVQKPEGQLRRVLNSEKFKKLFPDFRFMALEKALSITAEWFVKNAQGSNQRKEIKI